MDLKTLYYCINSFPEAYLFFFAIGYILYRIYFYSTNHGVVCAIHVVVCINHDVVCKNHAVN